MEKRSRQRVRDQVALLAFGAELRMRIERARISMMARNRNVPFKGRIQKRKTYHLQIVTFGLQRAAGSIQKGHEQKSRRFANSLFRCRRPMSLRLCRPKSEHCP